MSTASKSSTTDAAPAAVRRHIPVAGADAVLADLRAGIAAGAAPGLAAARALARHQVDWPSIRASIVEAERSIVLAGTEDGHALAARAFQPGRPTTIHDHGTAGAAVVVEGRQRYERFTRDAGAAAAARLESIHELAAGDVVWWGEPPDDLHRQETIDGVAIELVLLAGPLHEVTTFAAVTEGAGPFRRAVVAGFLGGDVAVLRTWYHDDALFDLNVPHWRFQVRGAERGLQMLRDEEFAQAGRRLAFLRATDTAAGLLLETEGRHVGAEGTALAFREVHQLRLRDGRVAEHVLWCTGVNDAEAVRQQFETAPMERM